MIHFGFICSDLLSVISLFLQFNSKVFVQPYLQLESDNLTLVMGDKGEVSCVS